MFEIFNEEIYNNIILESRLNHFLIGYLIKFIMAYTCKIIIALENSFPISSNNYKFSKCRGLSKTTRN